MDFLIDTDNELVRLKQFLDDDDMSGGKLANVYDMYNAIDRYLADARASSTLVGLRFTQNDAHNKLKEFSGGWQVRASLAATLFAPSDCLLFDEPTNHLDLEIAM
jgi:ATP-binding cassette subfamily F protein 3